MPVYNIYKATRMVGRDECVPVESVTINIHTELPETTTQDLAEWRAVAMKEALALDEALSNSLPQGVYDALLVRMLERKRSLFVVPMEQVEITYRRK